MKRRQQQAAYEKQQKEIDRLEDFIAKNKARISTTSRAKSRQKQLNKMELIENVREKIKPTFKFAEARTSGRLVLQAKQLVIGYGEPLTSPLNLTLERGQKVAVKGVNGVGKTTLLKTFLGILPPVAGELELDPYLYPGYFEQEEPENHNTALEEVWQEFPGMTNGEVRSALARCGLTTNQ